MNEINLADTQFFDGMSEKEIRTALDGLSSVERKYRKGSRILHAGSTTDSIGLVLEGSVTIESNDLWGNRTTSFTHKVCQREPSPLTHAR